MSKLDAQLLRVSQSRLEDLLLLDRLMTLKSRGLVSVRTPRFVSVLLHWLMLWSGAIEAPLECVSTADAACQSPR